MINFNDKQMVLMLMLYGIAGLMFVVGSLMFWITNNDSNEGSFIAPGNEDGKTIPDQLPG